MPNWCSTHISIYSRDKSSITDLHLKIRNWLGEPALDSTAWDGKPEWLGNMLLHAGLTWTDKRFPCRGYISYLEKDIQEYDGYYYMSLITETAWQPMMAMWPHILHKLYPERDIRVAYTADEPNDEIYEKWDPENLFYENYAYYIDCSKEGVAEDKITPNLKYLFKDTDNYYSECMSKDDAIRLMQQVLGSIETDEKKLIKAIEQFDDKFSKLSNDAFIRFHRYDLCRPEDN